MDFFLNRLPLEHYFPKIANNIRPIFSSIFALLFHDKVRCRLHNPAGDGQLFGRWYKYIYIYLNSRQWSEVSALFPIYGPVKFDNICKLVFLWSGALYKYREYVQMRHADL